MSRNKLIAKYSALNSEDLPNRIYDEISEFITLWGIDDMPLMMLSGRWTGTLTISNGGWHNTHDFNCSLLQLCRVDRTGLVSPDMAKILNAVQQWRYELTTPMPDDDKTGLSDDNFNEECFKPDSTEHMSTSEKYLAATELGDYTSAYDFDFQTSGAKDMFDQLLNHMKFEKISDEEREDGVSIKVFKANLDPEKETDDEDDDDCVDEESEELDELRSLLENIQANGSNSWLSFIEQLRTGAFGELPEDYDGLSDYSDLDLE